MANIEALRAMYRKGKAPKPEPGESWSEPGEDGRRLIVDNPDGRVEEVTRALGRLALQMGWTDEAKIVTNKIDKKTVWSIRPKRGASTLAIPRSFDPRRLDTGRTVFVMPRPL